MNDQKTLLQIDGVTKIFPGVRALDNVTFSVVEGEVHGLVGENGAGKSTLMAVASGALVPETGRVVIDGNETRGDTEAARRLGLAIVRQEPALMPDLTVAENLYLGVPVEQRPSLMEVASWARGLLKQWSGDVAIDANERVVSLGPEQRFIVEIVKALAAKPKVLVLDEPTEHLLTEDVDRLFERIRKITASGCAVVYISHRIREVQRIAHRLTVLRDGQGQGTYEAAGLSEQEIVELIVGGALDRDFPAKGNTGGAGVMLDVTKLRGAGFTDISVRVKQGEIVGLAGIDGNGQREFMRALAGQTRSRGNVAVAGVAAKLHNSQAAADAGIRYLPGDRHREGIFGELSVRENFSIRSLPFDAIKGWVNPRSEARRARDAVMRFAVKTPSIDTPIRSLSGGNQQKLVLASVLASHPKVLLVDEPTQGVDIGARMEIYKVLREAAAAGTAVIVVSSDAHEVAGLCDRVLIFSRGHIVKELGENAVSENNITQAVLTATTEREKGASTISGLWKWAAGDWAPLVMLAVAVCALGLYAAHVNPAYLSARNLSGMLALVATLAIVAYGQQTLMLVGGIDLSVGPLMGLIVVIQSFFLNDGASLAHQFSGWGIVLLVVLAVGFVNWMLVGPFRLHPMVATLATYMALQAVSLLLRPVPGGLIADPIVEAIGGQLGFVPIVAIVAIVMAVVLEIALYKSKAGLTLRGVGSRVEAARMSGARPQLTQLAAYMGCSLLAGLAAVPMMAQVGSGDPSAGINYTLGSVAAVVIGGASLFGGRGSFVGSLLGALLIIQVNVVTSFLDIGDSWQSYLLGGMILASVALYSKSREMVVAK
ncbi:ATP-binding cassette domain-containing protein [Paraburkholderia silviterrae]|uniref:ATP-binding cassette domain-containing protein n=1 Tax=Paraburkholderia silviterrae TaxID=2528715 RepID=A0A4R5M566_9BURK|nr:ATP-binding cassette domain-containing protein [Paraburkholderia silviterrae]TDG20947.1 ATP-binding cassette domain-containing protein [Paraburkholderia silviterrae]